MDSLLPPAIGAAQAAMFGTDELYFVPIRHHSPACAMALRALLQSVRPAAILIEGPDDLNHLLPLLQHPQTRPPVAWLCQSTRQTRRAHGTDDPDEDARSAPETRTSFFPFCDHSPEWIAAREGAALGAQVALIDLPWSDKAWSGAEDEQDGATARGLMHERHFAHSHYLAAMAARLGCADHHELWERLFELRPVEQFSGDWHGFFADVLAWCAMARRDYEPEVLEAELSLPRERHMAAHIRAWRGKTSGPIVVVTGGFHTLELLQSWRKAKPLKAAPETGEAWLIRYSFDKLDALNGYGAGMPSPGYHQAVWERMQAGDTQPHRTVALDQLTALARRMRTQDQGDAASTALVQAAAAQALRLAALRGNAGPGRQDLIDATRSCFVKGAIDEGTRGFHAELRHFLAGTRLGDIPPSAGSPPLIEDARRLALAAGVRLDDSTPRNIRLDLYRKPRHRLRSRFFHAMAYLETGLASWTTGPDFLAGSRLHLLIEEWRAAWSPLVEARLIELAADGASIEAACLARLQREEAALAEHGQARSAGAATLLLTRACLVGLQPQLPRLLAMLSAHLDEDASLASVVDCGHRLVGLWRAREPLGVQQHPQIAELLARVGPAALFLLPQLAAARPEAERQAVQLLLSLRELGRLLAGIGTAHGTALAALDRELLAERLRHFATDPRAACAVAGAATALLYLDGQWDDAALQTAIAQRFGPGAVPADAVRFLNGLMAAAPELLLRLPALLAGLDALVRGWDGEAFVHHLPELRQAFTQLRPQETAELARRLADLHGVDGDDSLAAMHYEVSETDLQQGLTMEQELSNALRRDGLSGWLGTHST